ncbi:MAG: serine/threonine protein kinase [Deltaproteobacteria bacterium]|nr:serine/threonine protein kinase [Deltaproteobacteria bacterium]
MSAARPYRFVRTVAEGGMGTVELAVRREGDFRRLYALKRPHPELARDPEARRAFRDEARLAGLLHHPNVVSVLDVGEDRNGPFAAMEFIHGVSLSKLLRTSQGPLPEYVACSILHDVAQGLHAAHSLCDANGRWLRLVHRDVSPANIIVGFDGVARLADFGIAKVEWSERTSTGILKGKLGYFSPEQLRFERATASSDLFSFGVVMWEALAGRRLYRRGSPEETVRAIAHEPAPDLLEVRHDVHPMIQETLFGLLAKDPEGRIESAELVASRLRLLIADMTLADPGASVGAFLRELFPEESRQNHLEDFEDGARKVHRRLAVAGGALAAMGTAFVAFVSLGAPTPTASSEKVIAAPANDTPTEGEEEEPAQVALPVPIMPAEVATDEEPEALVENRAPSGAQVRRTNRRSRMNTNQTRTAERADGERGAAESAPTDAPRGGLIDRWMDP